MQVYVSLRRYTAETECTTSNMAAITTVTVNPCIVGVNPWIAI